MAKRLWQIVSCPEWWLIIIPLLAYHQLAFFQNTMKWDATDQVFVWHRFISECFHAHILPLWCPYCRLGYPFFADPQSGLFYPVTWLFTFFSEYTLYSNNLEFLFHFIGAAFGMRFLLMALGLRRHTACAFGVIYALSGPFVSNATHYTFISSLCWLPFILGSYIRLLDTMHRRYALLMSACLYLQLSGGYMGVSIILFYVLLFMMAYYLVFIFPVRRPAVRSFISAHILPGVTTVLLSAGFFYALWQGLPYMDRQNGVSLDAANRLAFTPSSFLTFLYPCLTGNGHIDFGTDITMRDIYIGVLTLMLVFVSVFRPSRLKVTLLGASLFFLMAALGKGSPVYIWLYRLVPLMNFFRMVAIFRFFACIGLLILAAFGFEEVFGTNNRKQLLAAKGIAGCIMAVLAFLLAVLCIHGRKELIWPAATSWKSFAFCMEHASVRSSVFFQAVIQLLLFAAAFSVLIFVKAGRTWPRHIFAAVMVLDLCLAVQANMFTTIIDGRSVCDVQGYINKLPGGFPSPPDVALNSFNEWNDSTLAPPIWQNAGFLRKQVNFNGYNGFVLNAYNEIADSPYFGRLMSERMLIESKPDPIAINIERFVPGHITFHLNSISDNSVYLGQFYFAGWQAMTATGKSCRLSADSFHLIRIEVPAGDQRIDVLFEPRWVRLAFWYTIFGFLLVFGGVCIVFRPRGLI